MVTTIRPSLSRVQTADHTTVCRLLVKHHSDLARWRNKVCCRLHALVAGLTARSVAVAALRSPVTLQRAPTGAS